ncbi:MAG: 2,4-dienoyl-CoA reductase-like NADH-dependent reductase (Old Yellow Enzyme family) [Gammaproteobacteria bacterium]|jgi:2,4-dienoyl-CoA reductase-like NADH-dependent reductase (Old Yellow Enzyme family)/thioredoxin reductase
MFEQLLAPLTIRQTEFRNRIFSTGHMTRMTANGLPTAQMMAYHEARASGGAGLIIIEAARVHETALSDSPAIDASTDACIKPYAELSDRVQQQGCRIFGQVSHSGRANDRKRNGMRDVPYSASASPDERFHNMPRAMSINLIEEVIDAYALAAGRLARAGLDGIEIPASHGLLPAQFLNPRVNRRDDDYGGELDNRLRFLKEIIRRVRAAIGDSMVLGIRLSVDELEHDGIETGESTAICTRLNEMVELDYFNVIAGSMAGLAGSVHVVPPMMIAHGYTAPLAASIKKISSKPIFVAGRINQPQLAQQVLQQGQADMCGMTRALIADPQMPNKVMSGEIDEIRACIGCNQACIGHFHFGTSISCIQYPVTGRELSLGQVKPATAIKRIAIIGGGPAGLKSAATAAERGHQVVLCEAQASLGGQARLAQLLPGRAEFGGIVTNLEREARNAGVEIRLNTRVDQAWLEANRFDQYIVATGATPYRPDIPGADEAQVVDAWQVLNNEVKVGTNVVIADWRADWVGMGLAELLARQGSRVRLAVNGMCAGQEIQSYTRDQWTGTLHKLGVEIIPYARLYGVDADSVYLQHTLSSEAIVVEQVDTLVLALGHVADTAVETLCASMSVEAHLVGDCLSPRTAEEAVYEGMLAGIKV